MSRMTSTTVYLEEQMLERLHALKERDRVPVAAMIRAAIARMLEEKEQASG